MSLNRFAKRVDATQDAIVSALRAAGAHVLILSKPVALLVGVPYTKKLALFECKTPKVGKLTKAQLDFLEEWYMYPLFVVDSPENALEFYRELSK